MTKNEFQSLPVGAKLTSSVNGHTYHKLDDQSYRRDGYEPGVDPEWDALMAEHNTQCGVYGLDYMNGEALKVLFAAT